MNNNQKVVVAGLGEVGAPLLELLSGSYDTIGVDIEPVKIEGDVEVLHVCYPFQIEDFVGETARYIEQLHPKLTVINSTVAVGTTRTIAARSGSTVVYSPVRGKHARMLDELRKYRKFVGAMDPASGLLVAKHFEGAGLKTKVLSSPEACELAKLTETTYFGLMIAWAQELERYCDQWETNYDEIVSFFEEINFFPPVKYFPGVIGGHCVMPNIEILKQGHPSEILEAIEKSNAKKLTRESDARWGARAVARGAA